MAYVAVASMAVSIGTSLLGAETSKGIASKQRDLAWNMKMAELAEQERISMEQIRTSAETDRLKLLSDSIGAYRIALQKESTVRLRDTWIYVAGLGCGTGVLYGLFLISSKGSLTRNE